MAIALYTLLVGAGAAVVRAAIMGGLALLRRQIGRRQQGLNSLGFVAALMVLEGYTRLRTDRDGWIELSTDGGRMWVEVERE